MNRLLAAAVLAVSMGGIANAQYYQSYPSYATYGTTGLSLTTSSYRVVPGYSTGYVTQSSYYGPGYVNQSYTTYRPAYVPVAPVVAYRPVIVPAPVYRPVVVAPVVVARPVPYYAPRVFGPPRPFRW